MREIMKYILDLHTHTVASGHAYSTIKEMAQAASEKGLQLLGITDHSMTMPGTCHFFYFQNLRVVPREQHGVELMLGSELNVIDYNGNVDMEEFILRTLDYAVASFHTPCIRPGSMAENTRAARKVMENPYVLILGHPDDGRYSMDYEEVVRGAKETGTILELNNSSLQPNGYRQNAYENDRKILSLCVKHGVPIVVDSDAHVDADVGSHQYAEKILEELAFPEELILNDRPEYIKKWILRKRAGL